MAAQNGNTDCVRLLLQGGADKDAITFVRCHLSSYWAASTPRFACLCVTTVDDDWAVYKRTIAKI